MVAAYQKAKRDGLFTKARYTKEQQKKMSKATDILAAQRNPMTKEQQQ